MTKRENSGFVPLYKPYAHYIRRNALCTRTCIDTKNALLTPRVTIARRSGHTTLYPQHIHISFRPE